MASGEAVTNASLFLVSVNRALRRLYNDIIIPKEIRIAARKLKPVAYHKEIHCKNGQYMEFPINGFSYSMRFLGCGKYMITDGEVINTYSVDSQHEAKLINGYLTYGGKISFWGSFSFTIYDFTVYDEVLAPEITSIPEHTSRRVFNLRDMYGDFMCFLSAPTDKYRRPIPGCTLQDGKLETDADYEGEILLSYRRLPKEVIDTMETQIVDVPDEYLHIFQLLAASYYWFYFDENLSKHYLSLYEEGVKLINNTAYTSLNSLYVDTNGWA